VAVRLSEKLRIASRVKTTIEMGLGEPDLPSTVMVMGLGCENSSSVKDSMAKKP